VPTEPHMFWPGRKEKSIGMLLTAARALLTKG